MHDTQIALVTGASRGIGAEVAQLLAHPGTRVINAPDIADETAAESVIADIRQRFGRLDTLILNAPGVLAHGVDARAAMRVNRDAQRRIVELAMPLMPIGA